jgi:hypothetical protein
MQSISDDVCDEFEVLAVVQQVGHNPRRPGDHQPARPGPLTKREICPVQPDIATPGLASRRKGELMDPSP